MTGVPLAGIDVGSTHCKVGLYDVAGGTIAFRRTATPDGPPALRDTVLRALADAVAEAGRPPAAVGLTGMAETGVPLDRALEPLTELIRWDDPRGAAEAATLAADPGRAAVWRTSGANLSAKTPLSRWAWLSRHRPAVLAATRSWVGAAELVAMALTGEPATDPTLAGRTGGYDARAARWDEALCAAAGLPPAALPRVVPAGEPAGAVKAPVAARCGLRPGTPVVLAGHDHLVAAYASGARGPGALVDSMGTAEALVLTADRPPDDTAAADGISWNRHADGRRFCLLAGYPGAGRLIDRFCQDVLARTDTASTDAGRHAAFAARTDAARTDAGQYADFAAFAALAERAARRPTGIVLPPYPSGRTAPDPDPAARLTFPTGPHPDLALALLENACLAVRWMADALAAHAATLPAALTVLGGPSRSGPWLRVKATATGLPVRAVAEPEAACAGAAMLAGAAIGVDLPPLPSSPLPAGPEADRYTAFYRDRFLPAMRTA